MFSAAFVQDVGEAERRRVRKLAFGLGHQTERARGGFLVPESEEEYAWDDFDLLEALFELWPGLESVGFVDHYTEYLKDFGWEYVDPEEGEEFYEEDGNEDEDEEKTNEEEEEEEEEEEIDIEAWKWWPKEYHVLVDGTYEVGGMTEEMLLGNFEERVEKLGFKVPEQRYLEVRKVINK